MKSDMGGQNRHGNKWIFLVDKHCLQPRLMRTRVPTALGSNVHAAELAFSCTLMHLLGIPETFQKRPNPLLMANLSKTEADSGC